MKASLTQLCVYQTWHDFDQAAWKRCRDTAVAAQVSSLRGVKLLGNDIHEGALSLCKRDAQTAGVLHLLDLSCNDCRDYQPSAVPSLVVTNPPWGSRLTDSGWVFASTPDLWIQCAVICHLQSCEHFRAGVHQRGKMECFSHHLPPTSSLTTNYGIRRGLKNLTIHQVTSHLLSQRDLKTSPPCHNRWAFKILNIYGVTSIPSLPIKGKMPRVESHLVYPWWGCS